MKKEFTFCCCCCFAADRLASAQKWTTWFHSSTVLRSLFLLAIQNSSHPLFYPRYSFLFFAVWWRLEQFW